MFKEPIRKWEWAPFIFQMEFQWTILASPSGPQKQIDYNTWISLNMRIEITNRADYDIQFSTRPNVNFKVRHTSKLSCHFEAGDRNVLTGF